MAPRRDLRITRHGLGLLLGVLAEPVALLAERSGGDAHLIFAVLWLGAVVALLPVGRDPWDWLAMTSAGLYVAAFLLPAGAPSSAPTGSQPPLAGYQVFGLAPVGPIRNLPEGGLMPTIVGLTAWLANPLYVVGLGVFGLREGALSAVVGGAAVGFGLIAVPAADLGAGHVAWLAAPLLLAIAGWWARRSW